MLRAMQTALGNDESPIQVVGEGQYEESIVWGAPGRPGNRNCVQFVEAVRQLGLYWLVLNEAPPL